MTITEMPRSASPSSAEDLVPSLEDSTLHPGMKVEVRRRFDAKWARGFEIIDVSGDVCRLRRLSDGEELPVAFAIEDVRREKHKGYWWY